LNASTAPLGRLRQRRAQQVFEKLRTPDERAVVEMHRERIEQSTKAPAASSTGQPEQATPTRVVPDLTDAPIFVVGFPRSGTTLTQSLIGAHPRIAAPPEMHFFARVVVHRNYWGDLADDANVRRVVEAALDTPRLANCGFDVDRIVERALQGERRLGAVLDAIMRDFAVREGKARWCEKTPLQSAQLIWSQVPNAQVVHVVRDPRESLASGFALSGGLDPTIAARQWRKFTIGNIRAGVERGAQQYLRIRYEDLTRDPQAVLGEVFAFLREDFDPTVLTDVDRRRSVLTAVVVPWQAKVLEPIRPASEGNWHKAMNPTQRARVTAIIGDALPGLGYGEPRRAAMTVGKLLNTAMVPRHLILRYRFVSAIRRLRSPEDRYQRAMRNWHAVHEQTTVDGAVETARRAELLDAMGVWAG
jgi:hypothetical protein